MKQEITYEDYSKVEIKIGTVLSVKRNEKARKPSLVVEVDFGKEIGIKKERPNPFGLPDLVKPKGWAPPIHIDNHGKLKDL